VQSASCLGPSIICKTARRPAPFSFIGAMRAVALGETRLSTAYCVSMRLITTAHPSPKDRSTCEGYDRFEDSDDGFASRSCKVQQRRRCFWDWRCVSPVRFLIASHPAL
jgi:hypothetical protein